MAVPRPTSAKPTADRRDAPSAKGGEVGAGGATGGSAGGWAKVLSRRYHFSIASFAYIATTCVLVIGAVNGQNNLLFWIFGLAVAGLLISGTISGWSLMGIHVRRRVVAPSAAGEPFRVEYTIRNSNFLFGAFGLVLEELPEGRNWFGKRFAADWHERIAPIKTFIAHVPARTTLVIEGEALALRRGVAHLGPMRVSSTFPFGITRKSITLHQVGEALIRPQQVALSPAVSLSGGEARADSRGLTRARAGDDMFALREYQEGDAPRSIAWRASARVDRPIVRDPAIRKGRRVWIVLDSAGDLPNDQSGGETAERSISLAAALLERGVREGAQVGLISASQGVLLPAGPLSPARLGHTLDTLARLDANGSAASDTEAVLASLPVQDGRMIVSRDARFAGEHLDPMRGTWYRDGELPALPPDPASLRADSGESLGSIIRSLVATVGNWSRSSDTTTPVVSTVSGPGTGGGSA